MKIFHILYKITTYTIFALAIPMTILSCASSVQNDALGLAAETKEWIGKYQDNGGRLSSELAILITGESMTGGEFKLETFRSMASETGTAVFNGRRLPAAIVVIEIQTVNRQRASYGKLQFIQTGILDREFQMWRDMRSIELSSDYKGVEKDLVDWRKSVNFQHTSGATIKVIPSGLPLQ